MVYFIRPRNDDPLQLHRTFSVHGRPIKIGSAVDPRVRLADLARLYGRDDLEILGAIPGGMGTEASLHLLFAGHRIRYVFSGTPYETEWFRPGLDLLSHIEVTARPVSEVLGSPVDLSLRIPDRLLMVIETAALRGKTTPEGFIQRAVSLYLTENRGAATPFKF